MIASDRRSGSDRRSLSLTLTLPDMNLTIFPSISWLISGRRSEPIIIHKYLHCIENTSSTYDNTQLRGFVQYRMMN